MSAIDKSTLCLVKPEDASKNQQYKCPDCQHDAIFCHGRILPPYFRHKAKVECCNYTNETESHLEAKFLLKKFLDQRNTTLEISRHCRKCDKVFELTIDPLETETMVIEEWSFRHNDMLRIADLACIQKDGTIEVIFEICNTHKTNCDFRPEPWFELDAKKTCEILLSQSQGEICKLECIRTSYNDDMYAICRQCEPGKIFFNQRGAGCGKTYESIQLIQSERFSEKNTFIYLTKMKSAKVVVYDELISQFSRNAFKPEYQIQSQRNVGNQYRVDISVENGLRNITVIIGTIDSFTYAIRKRREKDTEYEGQGMFEEIVNDLCKGHMTVDANGVIRYAGSHTRLAADCLIIIDECQDLGVQYIEAFDKLIDRTGIDTYIIGDKLQSILAEKNISTHIENASGDRVIKNTGLNIVKRFHNQQFIPFVNSVVKFTQSNLPSISGICDGKCCGYDHEDDKIPYMVDFNCPNIFRDKGVIEYVETLIADVKSKVKIYGYLPNNFCFIFPIVNSKNVLIQFLFPALQEMWVQLFAEKETYSSLFLSHLREGGKYWERKLKLQDEDIDYYQYVFHHSSEQNGTIDLNESAYSTRILSIHSSKGTGCECVYLLGLSEFNLSCFTGGIKDSLVYESLLHVGLTRQKKYLFVGITDNVDNISNRFRSYATQDMKQSCSLDGISKFIKVKRICEDWLDKREITLFDKREIRQHIRNDQNRGLDWGHHLIRIAVFHSNANKHLVLTTPHHVCMKHLTLIDPKQSSIKYVVFKEYKDLLKILNKKINANIKNNKREKLEIPILIFSVEAKGCTDYSRYKEAIKSLCCTVIEKIRKRQIDFCPLECLMYCHLMEMSHHPYDLSISIMEIYKIISYYNDSPCDHRSYGCECHNFFVERTNETIHPHADIRHSVMHHYEVVERVDTIMKNLLALSYENLKFQELKYKVDKQYSWGDDFDLTNRLHFCTEPKDGIILCLYLSPQFNNMNYISIMNEMIMNSYLIKKTDPSIKTVLNYLLTLDSIEPIFFNTNIDNHMGFLDIELANYIKETSTRTHDRVFQFSHFHGEKMGLGNVIKKMKEETDESGKKKKVYPYLPKYIIEAVEEMDKQLVRRKISKSDIWDEKFFKAQLEDELNYKVDRMFNLVNDEDI